MEVKQIVQIITLDLLYLRTGKFYKCGHDFPEFSITGSDYLTG